MVLTGKFLKSEIQNKTVKVEETVQNVAHTIENLSPTKNEISTILKQIVANNPGETYGMAMSYLPEVAYFSPYYFLQNDSIYYKNLAEIRSEEHTSELQSRPHLVCRLLLEKK